MNCKNCGAPLKRYLQECEYCGTANPTYNVLKIETFTRKPISVNVVARYDADIAREYPKDSARYVINEIREKIAKEIMPYIDVKREYDDRTNSYVFNAKLDVISFKKMNCSCGGLDD